MHPLVLLAGGAGLLLWLFRDESPSAFISFAAEDATYRTYLVGQSKHPDSRFKIKDKSLHQPFSNAWKTQTRKIIRDSDMLILMIGSDTHRADGAIWEVEAALAEGVPVFGVHINKKPKGRVPACMRGQPVIAWTHKGLAREIGKAARKSKSKSSG